ncbi:hypothetical protein [Nocardia sp. NPDC049526]|uniref:hypothetical protein n=1 Tax=Nocardia sp. NPDC049526 TaxID=3364316 RepID=UPI003788D4E3
MPLTEPQAKVLGVLAGLKPAEALTVRELCSATGLNPSRARAIVTRLSYDGLLSGTSRTPAAYWITTHGRAIIQKPAYRDYVRRHDITVSGVIR